MVMTIKVNISTGSLWKKYSVNNSIIWLKGYVYSHKIDEITKILKDIKYEEISDFIKSINGHFALILKRDDLIFAAVDKIKSTPIFFTKINDDFLIDHDPKNLVNMNEFNKTIDNDAKLEVSMSGFTIGNKTIYKNLLSLKAGEIVVFKNSSYEYIQYYKYFGELANESYDDYLNELSKITVNIFQKLLSQIGNRQIIIPLSAGNDSRLVASVLKHLGAKNVKCYSYGTPGNFEAKVAKKVAEKLGYEWKFIALTHKSEKNYYKSSEYEEYLNYSQTYCSVPYIQSLSTIKYLKDTNWIHKDAVFINGNSGDFISGGHIKLNSQGDCNTQNEKQRKENILTHIIEKHFSLWSYLKSKNNISQIKNNLWKEITFGCGELLNKNKDHLFYEYSEFIDRQSSYVISGQRIYEYYHYDWRLPLWDDEYISFWRKVPLDFKHKKKLYLAMLKKNNFSEVWGDDIPVNEIKIIPQWIIPLRFICKIPFGIFGKLGRKAWKQFDINIFFYWSDVTRMMKTVSYFRVICSFFKGPRNQTSWRTEDYLKKISI